MDNLLPSFQQFKFSTDGDGDGKDSYFPTTIINKYSTFTYADTIVTADKVIPYGLGINTVDDNVISEHKYRHSTYTYPKPAPNDNYRNHTGNNDCIDESPLSNNQRGFNGKGSIVLPSSESKYVNIVDSNKADRREDKAYPLLLQLFNVLDTPMDVFIQQLSSINSSSVKSKDTLIKVVSGQRNEASSFGNKVLDYLNVAFSTSNRALTSMAANQHIHSFTFLSAPIGLEVEYVDERLVCTKVLPQSQAECYANDLEGVEIISVNNIRVITLDEFKYQVRMAQLQTHLTIQAAIYNDAISKARGIHKRTMRINNLNVKNLLSNIMRTGIDLDHSHGLMNKHSESQSPEEAEYESEEDEGTQLKIANHLARKQLGMANKSDSLVEDGSDSYIVAESKLDNDYHHKISYINNENESMIATIKTRARHAVLDDCEVVTLSEDYPPEVLPKVAASEVIAHAEESTWEYTTAVPESASDDVDVGPCTRLVCMPSLFLKSKGWNSPSKYMLVSNFSNLYNLHVHWVDADSALIHRKMVPIGNRHTELVSTDHIWVIIAILKITPADASSFSGSDQYKQKNHDDDHPPSVYGNNSPLIIIRPNNVSLSSSKCTTLMWVPNYSITSVQSTHAAPIPQRKMSEGYASRFDPILPNMHVQVLDRK